MGRPRKPGVAKKEGAAPPYLLRLYVSGSTPNSLRAITNLKQLLGAHVPGEYTLEVIDLYQQPELAREAQLVAAPTLVKELPLPVRRLVGDMSREDSVLRGLGIVSSKDG